MQLSVAVLGDLLRTEYPAAKPACKHRGMRQAPFRSGIGRPGGTDGPLEERPELPPRMSGSRLDAAIEFRQLRFRWPTVRGMV